MKKRKQQTGDEIHLQLFPENQPGKLLSVKYVNLPIKPLFKKAVKLASKKKALKDDLIFFNIVGIHFQFKTKKDQEKLFSELIPGSKLTVKHEFKNKFDEYACAIYFKGKKIGYVPRGTNQKIINQALKKKTYSYYISSEASFYFFDKYLKHPTVVGVLN